MVRPPACLRLVLVLLLAMQWGMAFAHCLAPFGRGAVHNIEICTGDGTRALVVGEDGQPAAPVAGAHDSCPLCPGSAAPPTAAPPLPASPVAYARAVPHCPAGLPSSPPRAPPQQPRAPPIA